MRVLIACEFSGVVREAFKAKGHEAWSCDLLPTEIPGNHIRGDVLRFLHGGVGEIEGPEGGIILGDERPWDLMIAHPPCKFLALCQVWRLKPSKIDCILHGLAPNNTTWRLEQREKAVQFAKALWEAPIHRICLENPMSILSTRLCKKSQTINPWQFGHGEKKETWLWLKNLPALVPTNVVQGREQRVWKMSPSKTRSYERSRTFSGIAKAMAEQWTKDFQQTDGNN